LPNDPLVKVEKLSNGGGEKKMRTEKRGGGKKTGARTGLTGTMNEKS